MRHETMLDQDKVGKIKEEMERGGDALASVLAESHPSEIAAAIDRFEDEEKILETFGALGPEDCAEVLPHLNDRARSLVLEKSSAARLCEVIEELDSDDAADILADMSKERAEEVLRIMSEETGEEVIRLMAYDEDSAGHLMQTELIAVPEGFTVAETIEKIRATAAAARDIHNVFVVDGMGRLRGVAPLSSLILSSPDAEIRDVMEDQPPIYVTVDADQEHVADLFKRYDLVSLPVVGPDMTLLGRILVDDIVDVLEKEADEDIMIMAGAHDEALVQTRTAAQMARYRLPWLGSSLVGGLITGALLWQFKMTISEALALTAFIPVVMGLSGNVGAQSSALVIRGIATGRMDSGSLRRYFSREVMVGILLGLFCGAAAGAFAHVWQGSWAFGVVVGLSIFLSIQLAALMGTAIPFFFRWANIDPAIAGGPIVLALNDITGLVVFFAMATALLGYLGG
ncbi:MAG: magnesium transporter [Candidatus Nitrospinota bacterium M3_3B_026]